MSNSEGRLSSSLFELSKDVSSFVEEQDDFQRHDVKVSKRVVDLDLSSTSKSFTSDHKTVTRTTWEVETPELVIEQAKELDSYEETLGILKERIDDSAEFHLHHFLQILMSVKEGQIDDKLLIDLVETFTSQIEGSPILWHPIIFLEGVFLEPKSISLPNEVTLRRPVEEDFEYEEWSPFLPRSPFEQEVPDMEHSFRNIPDSVLEFSNRAPSSEKITEFVNVYINVLKLYDIGSVAAVARQYNPEAATPGYSQPADFPTGPFTDFSYTISEDQIESVKEFCNEMYDYVLERIVTQDEDSPITIAFDRYSSALEKTTHPERQLTSAIMSLEALFLREEERGELSERLSRRAALLLSQFDMQPNKVSRKLREAYKIRSKYVHGSKLDEKADIGSLTDSVMAYTRRSIVTFIQLSEENGKDNLLSKIDNASVNPEAYSSLEEFVEEQCSI